MKKNAKKVDYDISEEIDNTLLDDILYNGNVGKINVAKRTKLVDHAKLKEHVNLQADKTLIELFAPKIKESINLIDSEFNTLLKDNDIDDAEVKLSDKDIAELIELLSS